METETQQTREERNYRLNISKLEEDTFDARIRVGEATKNIQSTRKSLAYAVATPILGIFGLCPLMGHYAGRGAAALAELGVSLGFIYLANKAAKKLVQCESYERRRLDNQITINFNQMILEGKVSESIIPPRYIIGGEE